MYGIISEIEHIMGMLKIARSGFSASRLSSEQARSSPQALLRCRGMAACSQALRSFAFQANTQFSTLRSCYYPNKSPRHGSFQVYDPVKKKGVPHEKTVVIHSAGSGAHPVGAAGRHSRAGGVFRCNI
jgi:hypothetical protein